MTPNKFLDFSSFNHRINIPLENFGFFHRPITGEEDEVVDGKYIEQRNATHHLYNWIRHNRAESGIYLVTGYRGAGKSSFVGMLLRKLKADPEHDYLSLSVNFGEENIEEIEVLRIVAKRLLTLVTVCYEDQYSGYKKRCYCSYFFLTNTVASLFMTLVHPKYLFYYLIVAAVSVIIYLLLNLFKPTSAIRAMERLQELAERLHATARVETVQEVDMGLKDTLKAMGLKMRKSRSKGPATIQEIEYDLIEILDLLKQDRPQRKVVVVFDELDKTEASGRRMQTGGQSEYEKLSSRPGQKISSRSRKEEVLRIIAGMKFFLSSAKAYFIFIAGREMYEAFQADLSDRDFSINSIFNGVININSFLTSTRNANNANRHTEEFVCRQLLPAGFGERVLQSADTRYSRDPLYTLKNYYMYMLAEGNDCYADELDSDGHLDRERRKRRVWRHVMALYHFVHYLSYVSNGSPKKLTFFFEKHVRRYDFLKQEDKIGDIRRYRDGAWRQPEGKEREAFYLSLGYYTQKEVNFVHYLTYPIMQNLVNRSNLYGDKLLVSASFLISHLFKLHNCGFSWRNLEQVPELLEINKTPELREYIGSIIDFMNHTHLTTIAFGLYHYKFPMRVSEEISFHSKLSLEVSALFNFSQDDIRGIKEHYLRLLGNGESGDATRYARASVHHTLGDLCMMEENYSNAVFEYEKCLEIIWPLVESLKKGRVPVQELNCLAFLNRTMLKLGLAHEKRRTDNSAFILYEELIRTLQSVAGRCSVLFKNMRTMHLALIARLYVLEKINVTGIQQQDLDDACHTFDRLFKGNNTAIEADFYRKLGDILYYKNCSFGNVPWKEINAKHYYYQSMRLLLQGYGVGSCTEDNRICVSFCKAALQIKVDLEKTDRSTNAQAARDNFIYHIALCMENLGHVAVSEYQKGSYPFDSTFLEGFSKAVKESRTGLCFVPCNNIERALLYYWTASRLYNISCERGLSTVCYKEMGYMVLTYLRNLNSESKLDAEILLDLYRNLAEHFLISQYRQYEHIHLSESDILQWMKSLEMYQCIELPDLSVFPDVEEMFYMYHTFKLCLYKELKKRQTEIPKRLLSSLSAFYRSDIMTGKRPCGTLVATVQNLKLKSRFNEQLLCGLLRCDAEDLDTLHFVDLADYVYGGPDDELVLAVFPEMKSADGSSDKTDLLLDLLEFLVVDGMFCLSRVLELVMPLRNTTLFNHSFKADIYMHLIRFNALYRLLYCYYHYGCDGEDNKRIRTFLDGRKHFRQKSRKIKDGEIRALRPPGNFSGRRVALYKSVRQALGKMNPSHTDAHFLAETSIHYYTKVRQIHCQGKSYQELIHNLFFLDDDLKNDTLQFYMAMERFEIASGIQGRIERRLKKMYSGGRAYRIDEYGFCSI